jgi:predicted dehydrogenase/threonine dehydrogenase-like Zn-dependent dehydrogenase
MKALLADLKSGQINPVDVPEPELRDGGALVRTAFSAISAGTEKALLETAEKSLLGKALARPDLVKQTLRFARTEGIRAAYERAQSRLDSISPLGYSCSGVVVATGNGVHGFQAGDRVACAGVGYANHSAVNFVPKNLLVKVPDSVGLDAAALTAIGAIAIHGLRQSDARFGETVAVIGAGLVGMLTIQLAKAAGCRVIAIDVQPTRVENALRLGADFGLCSNDEQTPIAVRKFSGCGADVVIVTAATSSTEPIELAAEISRDRGRIVVVGTVGLGVSRKHVYGKELSITMSRSYGPGRYDPEYEEGGVDYPIGYVRWTEKRNMEAFLQFLASDRIDVAPLIGRRFPVAEGDQAYADLRESGSYTVLLEYPNRTAEVQQGTVASKSSPCRAKSGDLRIGCIGAGNFARSVICPALKNIKGITLHSIATASGVSALSVSKTFNFLETATPTHLIQNGETDVVFVLSRHATHAQYVMAALRNHKPVFVEKPLATTEKHLDELRSLYCQEQEAGHSPFVMVGFNRRFAPMTQEIMRFFAHRQEPMAINVRVNAGYIPLDHWSQQSDEGGRIVGEFCHFVDWVRAIVGRPIQTVSARALPDGSRYNRDNIAVTISFADGSLANLLYLANGDKAVSKEHFEVFSEGGVAILDDFRTLELTRDGKTSRVKSRRDKGHTRELQLTIEAVRAGATPPIDFEELIEVSRACFAVERAVGIYEAIPIAVMTAAAS